MKTIDRKRILWLMLYACIGFAFVSAIIVTTTNVLLKETNPFSLEILSTFAIWFLGVLQVVLILLLLYVVPIIIGTSVIYDSFFMNNCLAVHIRKHTSFFKWMLVVTSLVFFATLLILVISLLSDSAEDFVSMTRRYGSTLLFSLEASILILVLVFYAIIIKPPKLLSSLGDGVSPELMVSDPESAIRKAFAFFEESLKGKIEKDKIGSDFLKKDKNLGNVIRKAYSTGSSILNCEKQEAVSDLMKGAYELYRNDLAHNNRKYPLQQAYYILMLVDDLLKRLDESELRQPNLPNGKEEE